MLRKTTHIERVYIYIYISTKCTGVNQIVFDKALYINYIALSLSLSLSLVVSLHLGPIARAQEESNSKGNITYIYMVPYFIYSMYYNI